MSSPALVHVGVMFRLEPTPQQSAQLFGYAAACRAVWNAALEQRETAWSRGRENVWFAQQAREVAPLRAAIPFIGKAPAVALHSTLRDLDRAYRRWWSGLARHPRWKSAKRSTPAFRVKGEDAPVCSTGRHVRLPKIGNVRTRISRELPGRAVNATVSFRAGHWFVAFVCEVPAPNLPPHTGPSIGLDLGIANTFTLSDGGAERMPVPSKADWNVLARWQRRRARRRPGSRGYREAVRGIQRWYERHGNVRRDFIAKAASTLTNRYGLIAVEDLNVAGMTRRVRGRGRAAKAGLNRALLQQAFGELRGRLEWRATWTGTKVVAVDPRYTSQTCHCCGHIAKANRESQAIFRCVDCGYEAHADVNAAQNILSRATGGQPEIDAAGVGCLERPTLNAEPYATSTEALHVA